MAEEKINDNNNNNNNNSNGHAKKRSFADMEVINEPLLPHSKRQKLNENNNDNDNDTEITAEDMEFLFHLKQSQEQQQQQQQQLSSLHSMSKNSDNKHVNITTDINHLSHFATASIASTNNSTTMDALSTTAAIDKNDQKDINVAHNEQHKDKAAEKYYTKIVQRPSRIGDRYQAMILPQVSDTDNNHHKYDGTFLNDDAKYGGIQTQVDSPTTIGDKLREQRNEKRNNLDNNDDADIEDDNDDDGEHENYELQETNGGIKLNEMNFGDDDDDDEDDEDFNLDEYDGHNVNNNNNNDNNNNVDNNNNTIRVAKGIISHRSDWLPGDEGAPNDMNTRMQYLVKWKDGEPTWEYADDLEMYTEKIDQYEDDQFEDEVVEDDVVEDDDGLCHKVKEMITIDKGNENQNDSNKPEEVQIMNGNINTSDK